jgi:hypothetical protein
MGSTISSPEIRKRNSSGTASAAHASDRAGDVGAGAADDPSAFCTSS